MILAQVADKDLLDKLGMDKEAYSERQKQMFKDDPELYLRLIKVSDKIFNDKYKVVSDAPKRKHGGGGGTSM
jgi:hypothetical protein